MRVIPVTAVHQGFGTTSRRDAWWAAPPAVFVGLSAFVVYATWAAFQNAHYTFGPYLSPFYSPEICAATRRTRGSGRSPAGGPASLPFSPALLILPFPGLFRFTCYYYRGAYYKSFWADPPSCAVGEPRTSYWGEHSFPLILQNVHRFFMWVALRLHPVLLAYDVWLAMWFTDPATGVARVRHRRRHGRPGGERRAARELHAGAATCCATSSAAGMDEVSKSAGVRQGLRLLERAEQPSPAVRVVQPVLGACRRPLRAPLLDGRARPT